MSDVWRSLLVSDVCGGHCLWRSLPVRDVWRSLLVSDTGGHYW